MGGILGTVGDFQGGPERQTLWGGKASLGLCSHPRTAAFGPPTSKTRPGKTDPVLGWIPVSKPKKALALSKRPTEPHVCLQPNYRTHLEDSDFFFFFSFILSMETFLIEILGVGRLQGSIHNQSALPFS